MDAKQRKEILEMIEREVTRLGSASRVATKCGVSDATISNIRSGKYDLITEKMWISISNSLGYVRSGWALVNTLNFRIIHRVLTDAKDESMWFAIAAKAGSGKTASLKNYSDANAATAVYYIQAREWNRREFLIAICRELGIELKGYVNMDTMGQEIVDYFASRRNTHPLLIIDEADKLKPAAMRFLIPLFNATEGVLGCVISGTDNLEKELKRGVRYNLKGYDELDSRFGRTFVHPIGATRDDVRAICEANGISDKSVMADIFKEAGPRPVNYAGTQTQVVDDLRRLKRIIMRERLKRPSDLSSKDAALAASFSKTVKA